MCYYLVIYTTIVNMVETEVCRRRGKSEDILPLKNYSSIDGKIMGVTPTQSMEVQHKTRNIKI